MFHYGHSVKRICNTVCRLKSHLDGISKKKSKYIRLSVKTTKYKNGNKKFSRLAYIYLCMYTTYKKRNFTPPYFLQRGTLSSPVLAKLWPVVSFSKSTRGNNPG